MFACLPKVLRYFANYISSTVVGFLLSTTNRIRCDSWMAVIVCLKISYLSLLVVDLLMRSVSTPGVSMTDAMPSRMLNSLRSLVVPRCLSTMAMRSPTMQLKRLLLPQFGNPTKETLNLRTSSSRLVFQAFFSWFNYNLVFLRVIMFSICSGVCRISCAFLARLEKENSEGLRSCGVLGMSE